MKAGKFVINGVSLAPIEKTIENGKQDRRVPHREDGRRDQESDGRRAQRRTVVALTDMKIYLRAFLIAGVIIPIFLHVIASKAMPWWPDTVSMGIAFGVVAVLVVSKTRREREQNRRLWKALRNLARHRDWS